jgi:hypothetical protein
VYERCLLEAERILAADKDVIVPVRKVWKQVLREAEAQSFEMPTLADFTALLEAHPTFEFMSSHSGVLDELEEEHSDDVGEEEEELERMGFYSGDRVKLRRITLTPEALGGLLRSKVDRTVDALAKAWERRPSGDGETEGRLLAIIEQTKQLQKDVKAAFTKQKMKKLSKALKKEPARPARSAKKKTSSAARTSPSSRRRTKPAPKSARRKKSRR